MEQFTTYKPNKFRKVLNIDFDGTLTDGQYVKDPTPNENMIHKVRANYFNGNIIIIWTARLWEDAGWMVGWLIKNKVPFHGVMMGKGGSDCYVDDKAVLPKDLLL